MSLVANAYGNALGSSAPFFNFPAYGTPFGTFLAPGTRIAAYVRSTGAQDLDDLFVRDNLVATLDAGLKRCRSGKNDAVIVLPGHSETLSGADAFSSLVAGTQIIGVGNPRATNAPTLSWATTASTFLLDVADVVVTGLKLAVAGADNVTAPVTVSAAGCSVFNNVFAMGTSSALECAQGIVLAAGADDAHVFANDFYNSGGAVCTNAIQISGAIARPRIFLNDIDVEAAGATDGPIGVAAVATTQGRIFKNRVRNRRASAAVCVRIVDAASDGEIFENFFAVDADVTVVGGTISASASSSHKWRAFQNYGHDENIGTALVGGIGTGTIE